MLAIGRALMARPRLLLLDEPSLGLAPLIVQEIFDIIREINARGSPCCWWSRTPARRCAIADRAYVLETGELTSRAGPPTCGPTPQ